MQVNIRNWKNNNYILKCSLSNSNPDVILLNEISIIDNVIPKIRGYHGVSKCSERNSGVAVFIKKQHKHTVIEFANNNNILAVKLFTNLGPIYIVTSYTPPRHTSLPTLELNNILNKNTPTIILSDFNATHPFFDNTKNNVSNNIGKQLYSLCNSRNL